MVGPIEWEAATSGFCRCPGEGQHTAKTGKKDCRVTLDGVPTIHCFHEHCGGDVEVANRKLRDVLGREDWTLVLPGGRVLRRGESVDVDRGARAVGSGPGKRSAAFEDEVSREVRESRDRIMEDYRWTYDEIRSKSPVDLGNYTPEDHFRQWLLLWPADAVLWIGEVTDSGRDEAGTHFRPVCEWYDIGPVMGRYTTGSRFRPGSLSRCEDQVQSREFLVVESDTLSKDQVGAVFRWMQRELRMDLHCIVDTGGKSLHAWFGAPREELLPGLKSALQVLGCDTKLFGASQPCRVPGAWREEKLQRLLWCRAGPGGETHSEKMVPVEVALGLQSPELPEWKWCEEVFERELKEPPVLIGGILHRGSKMLLGGTSKSCKTWGLMDMALSVACGVPWWGHETLRSKVAYVNFELPEWAMQKRVMQLCQARSEFNGFGRQLAFWNLRGHACDISSLRRKLERGLSRIEPSLVILDPAYKLLGGRDENNNGEIADLMNEFERISERTGAAVVIAHHFAKGDSSLKDAVDRMSGAGTWARDPDAIMVMTPHEEEDCFTVSSILRHMRAAGEFVVQWEFPLLRPVDLDPSSLRTTGGRKKACTDREFLECVPSTPTARGQIVEKAAKLGLSERTSDRYLRRLMDAALICCGSGLYWKK